MFVMGAENSKPSTFLSSDQVKALSPAERRAYEEKLKEQMTTLSGAEASCKPEVGHSVAGSSSCMHSGAEAQGFIGCPAVRSILSSV